MSKTIKDVKFTDDKWDTKFTYVFGIFDDEPLSELEFLFNYDKTELSFTSSELLGLTKSEIEDLYIKKATDFIVKNVNKDIKGEKIMKKFKVITLCGSSRFKKEFIEVAEKLSLEGNIVISLGLFGHADNKYDTVITDEIKNMLDEAHKQKIEMSDAIYVINPGGYIGKSTKNEIEYAKSLGKEIIYHEPIIYTFKGSTLYYDTLKKDIQKGRIFPKDGDIYLIGTAQGMKDDTDCIIGDLEFVVYRKYLKGWQRIDLRDFKVFEDYIKSEV